MIWRYSVSYFLLLFVTLISAGTASGQSTLPDIDCSYDKGSIFLIWNCQYDGVKSIDVLRSTDSIANYSVVGSVKKLNKGIQTFLDIHSQGGKSFYKLSITFKSGLKWNSNFCSIVTPVAVAPAAEPQIEPAKPATIGVESRKKPVMNPNISTQSERKAENANNTAAVSDTTRLDPNATVNPRRRVLITSDDPSTRAPETIKSDYISTDLATGHVLMEMPDNYKEIHYAVKFYNAQNVAVVEVPRVNSKHLILDKRNFQKKGSYKFVLRKDGLEFERGYVNISW